jgi:hypothetical protein
MQLGCEVWIAAKRRCFPAVAKFPRGPESAQDAPSRRGASPGAAAHLEKLGIGALKVNPDPTLIATEGALWGSVKAHGFLIARLVAAYPAFLDRVDGDVLVWKDGTRMTIDDGRGSVR